MVLESRSGSLPGVLRSRIRDYGSVRGMGVRLRSGRAKAFRFRRGSVSETEGVEGGRGRRACRDQTRTELVVREACAADRMEGDRGWDLTTSPVPPTRMGRIHY